MQNQSSSSFDGNNKAALWKQFEDLKNESGLENPEEIKQGDIESEFERVIQQQTNIKRAIRQSSSKEEKKKYEAILKNLNRQEELLAALQKFEGGQYDSDSESFIIHVTPDKQNYEFEQCKAEMRIAMSMPVCFEKALMEIIYLVELLKQDQPLDDLFGLKERDLVIQRLKEKLQEIKNLMEKERIIDQNTKTILQSAEKFLKNPTEKSCQDQLSILQELLIKIRPFFFSDFFNLINNCDQNSEKIENKTIILLLGQTGCGKSTTIQYLYGANMVKSSEGHIEADPMPNELKDFIASAAKRSTTRGINAIVTKINNANNQSQFVTIVDTAGLGDTQGHEVDISNSIGIIKSIRKCQKVYPVILFTSKYEGGKSEVMKELLLFYGSIIKDMNFVNYFFTNYKDNEDMLKLIQNIVKGLNAKEKRNTLLVDSLHIMEQQGKLGGLKILNPLDNQRCDVINHIMCQSPIEDPSENFNLVIREQSKASLNKQVELHIKFITEFIDSELNSQLVLYKINELKKLAQIFLQFEDTYQKKLEEISERLEERIKEKVIKLKTKIKICLLKDEELSEKDITSIKQDINLEQKISSLIDIIKFKDPIYSDEKMECDQSQNLIVQTIIEQIKSKRCSLIDHSEVSDIQWNELIKKAYIFQHKIEGFEEIGQIVMQEYVCQLKKIALKAINAINEISMTYNIQQQEFQNYQEEIKESQNNKSRQENYKNQQNNYEGFSTSLQQLLVALNNASNYSINELAETIKNYIQEIEQKLKELEILVKPYFQSLNKEYKYEITLEIVKNINLVFSMLNSFDKICRQISTPLANIVDSTIKNYSQLCIEAFKFQKEQIFNSNKVESHDKSSIIKVPFEQMNLLSKISQIETETRIMYEESAKIIQNKDSQKKIIELLNETAYSIENMQDGDLNTVIQQKIQQLKDLMKSLKTIKIAFSDDIRFKEKVMGPINSSFNNLLNKAQKESDYFSSQIEQKPQNLHFVACFFDLIQKLQSPEIIMHIELQQKDYGISSLKHLKQAMLQIKSYFESIEKTLMVEHDYEYLEKSIDFLKKFYEGNVSQAYKDILYQINSRLNDPLQQCQIKPLEIIDYLIKSLEQQQEIIHTNFKNTFQNLIQATSGQIEQQIIKQQNTIQETAKRIKLLFKVNSRNKKIFNRISPQNSDQIFNQDGIDLGEYMKFNYFNHLQKVKIQNRNRNWIYLKLESMIILKDLDQFIPGQIASQCYKDLEEIYCLNQNKQLDEAKLKFENGDFQQVHQQLQRLQVPPINSDAAEIIESIKEYINFKSNQYFQNLCNLKEINFELPQENYEVMYKEIENLLKLNELFGGFIKIRGNDMLVQLESEIFIYLEELFNQQANEIDSFIQLQHFQEAEDKIQVVKQIFIKRIQQAYNEIKNNQNKRILKFIEIINEKQNLLNSKFEEVQKFILNKKFEDAAKKPLAHNFYKLISNKKQQQFISELLEKFEDKYSELIDQLQNTQDSEEIQKIKKEADIIQKNQNYMPEEIKIFIEERSKDIQYQYNDKIELINLEVRNQLQKQIEPKTLSRVYLANFNIKKMNSELYREIQQYLLNNIRGVINKININLSEQKIINVFQYLPLLFEYKNDQIISQFINHELSDMLQEIQNQIKIMFSEAIKNLSRYFKITHAKSGDLICLSLLQDGQLIQKPSPTISFRVIIDILTVNQSQAAIVQDYIHDFLAQYKELIDNSIRYLREMRASHHQSIKQGHINDSISVLSNLKFTNYINEEDLFYQFLTETQKIYQQGIAQLINEFKITSFQTVQDEILTEILKYFEFMQKYQFIDKHRSAQVEIDTFYKNYYKNYDQIKKALQVEAKSPLNSESIIEAIYGKAKTIFDQNMKNAIMNMKELINLIEKGSQIEQDQYEYFNILSKSFCSMEKDFSEYRTQLEEINTLTKKTLTDRLIYLEKQSLEYYDQEPVNLHKLSLNLSKIQQMIENITLFETQIQKSLDNILADYSAKRSNDPRATIDLKKHLEGLPGSYGVNLSLNHEIFKGANILEANRRFQSIPLERVIEALKGEGNDLSSAAKQVLITIYKEYFFIYDAIIEEKTKVKCDSSGKRFPTEIFDIIANIKEKYSNQQSRQWKQYQIEEKIQFGMDSSNKIHKISFLIANIFALWSIMHSEHYKKAQDANQHNPDLKKYLLQPHPAQVFSILRILGVGYSSQYRNGPRFNPNWQNLFGHPSAIRNNLAQIKTGEGKSIILAVVSIILALNGFEVKCACYSKYLSQRDYESFEPMFRELGLQNMIKYGTFNEISELQVNREGEIREIVKCLVLKQEIQQSRPQINLQQDLPPQVLLIDEVDVFFSNTFFGKLYIPASQIKHQAISALCDYIWDHRQKQLEKIELMSQEDQKKAKEKPYLSLKALKETEEYKNVIQIFKPDYQFLVEEAAKRMIFDVIEYESTNHVYVIHEGKIGYEQDDLISTNTNFGYQTLFAYYFKKRIGEISEEALNQQKCILIDCATYSYAEVPLEYDIILGVTGTLETLSDPQKDIIKNVYGIEHKTYSPSVYSNDDSRIFNKLQGITIIKDHLEYNMSLVNEIQSKYWDSNRPVILFFENNEQLKKFQDCEEFKAKRWRYQIINEKDNNKEKQVKVLKATQAKTITLSTKNFGRGTDFVCYDQTVIAEGGLVVIQTFLSEDLSEETQIRGRTGRQGCCGTYVMFLNLQDLSKFNIELQEIQKSKNYYETLDFYRSIKIQSNQIETQKKRDDQQKDHEQSITTTALIKQIVANNQHISQNQFKDLKEHLLGLNKGITIETDQNPMKVLVLIDCTGSMYLTLQKTKNCLDKVIKELKVQLQKNNLDEDLILMKIAGYRNYSSLDKLYQASPGWSSNFNGLSHFLQSTLQIDGGEGNEAIEIGLWHANQEILDNKGIPLSMVIIIGDAPPNTVEEVKEKRKRAAKSHWNSNYWERTKIYKEETHWEKEIQGIIDAKVIINTFYVLNEKTQSQQQEKKKLETEFKKLCVNGGDCQFLDIHDQKKGQQQLQDLFLSYILYRAVEINLGKEEAERAVAHIPIRRHT